MSVSVTLAFDDEHAAVVGADDQPVVGPRVAAHDVMAKVRVEALRFPRRPLEQPGGGQARGRVPLDDGLQLERLSDAHEFHLARFLLAPRAARRVRQHVAERPSVQHCLRRDKKAFSIRGVQYSRYTAFCCKVYHLYRVVDHVDR